MEAIQGLVFDMDGTMFDTERLSVKAWDIAGRRMGLNISLDLMISIMGLPRAKIAQRFTEALGENLDFDKLRLLHTQQMDLMIEKSGVPIQKGLPELLTFAKERRIPCAVATSTSSERAPRRLREAKMESYFSAVVCGDMVERGKPHPDIFMRAADLLQVDPKYCLIMEDSKNGILAAHAAGGTAVLIPDMIPVDEDMRAAADYIVESLLDVIALIEKR